MSIELKIKDKHLAEEARIIKHEERKLLKRSRTLRAQEHFVSNDEPLKQKMADRRRKAEAGFNHLRHHRIEVVRKECRATHLARAFLKGLPATSVEAKAHEDPQFVRIMTMVNKYGPGKYSVSEIMAWYSPKYR